MVEVFGKTGVTAYYIPAYLAALTFLLLGIFAAFAPVAFAKLFGLEATKQSIPYVRALAARNIVLGTAVVFFAQRDDPVAVSWMVVAFSGIGFADALVLFCARAIE